MPAATTYLLPAAYTVPDRCHPQVGGGHGPEVRQQKQKLHKGSGTRVKETSEEIQMGSGGEAKSDVKPQEKVKMKPQTTLSVQSRVRHKRDRADTWVSQKKEASHAWGPCKKAG